MMHYRSVGTHNRHKSTVHDSAYLDGEVNTRPSDETATIMFSADDKSINASSGCNSNRLLDASPGNGNTNRELEQQKVGAFQVVDMLQGNNTTYC